jgi:hypothetical protein
VAERTDPFVGGGRGTGKTEANPGTRGEQAIQMRKHMSGILGWRKRDGRALSVHLAEQPTVILGNAVQVTLQALSQSHRLAATCRFVEYLNTYTKIMQQNKQSPRT